MKPPNLSPLTHDDGVTPSPTATRLLRDTPHQIQRLRDYLDAEYAGTALPGETAADWAIRVLREQRDLVSLAAALARAMGIDGPPTSVEGSDGRPGRLQPYQRRREVITALQIQPGLANYAEVIGLLPIDRYRVSATRDEIKVTDALTGEVHLLWANDWLVHSGDGGWRVLEDAAFDEKYEPVMPSESP